MMEFADFKLVIQRRFNEMKKQPIFQADIDKGFLWQLYIDSFPEGSNPVFRERTEYDCCACRSFIRNAGGMVVVENGKLGTIWDVKVEYPFQAVVDELANYVRACTILNVFLFCESHIGTSSNKEILEDNSAVTWNHLNIDLPANLVCKGAERGPRESEYRAQHDVVLRSLREISMSALETVSDLIKQNSLHKGAEKEKLVNTFTTLKKQFDVLPESEHDMFAWSIVAGDSNWLCKIRNDVIGTLLVDISENVDLEVAVKKFEDKVSGLNYKRPTALITDKMKQQAKDTLVELGLMEALDRRFANLDDIDITNVLFANRTTREKLVKDVFDDLPTKAGTVPKFDRVEEITITDFVNNILPKASSLELFLENRHTANLVSLIAPVDVTAPTMFKWPNPFSWSYNGDVASSDIRTQVQAKGGRVDGVFRFSHSWNYDKRNASLMDLHVFMPGSTQRLSGVNYGNNERVGWNHRTHIKSKGVQDVDYVIAAPVGYAPVENITFPDLKLMPEGRYVCAIHNWSFRDPTVGGFRAEIEFQGQVFEYEHDKPLRLHEWVQVATITLKNGVFSIEHNMPTTTSTKSVWDLNTAQFHQVSAVMLSPNFWSDSQSGSKHFFFMLENCRNDGSARGIYNEFLNSNLEAHRKTMEIVGSRMRTEITPNQLSGLGFEATKRNNVVVKVHGSFERTVKITF